MDKDDISKIVKVLKDDHRSYVYVFEVDGDNKNMYIKNQEKKIRKNGKNF